MATVVQRATFWLKRFGGPIRRFDQHQGTVCMIPLPGAERKDIHLSWTANQLIRVEAHKMKAYTLRGKLLQYSLVHHELIEPPKGATRDSVRVCMVDGILFLVHDVDAAKAAGDAPPTTE